MIAVAGSCCLSGFHLGKCLTQGVTFTGTMLEVKKTHVLVVLDLQQNADLQKFMKGAAGHSHAFRAYASGSDNDTYTHDA